MRTSIPMIKGAPKRVEPSPIRTISLSFLRIIAKRRQRRSRLILRIATRLTHCARCMLPSNKAVSRICSGTPNGGSKESFVPAFVGSASYHLGSVTGRAGLPPILSEIGGGAKNLLNAAMYSKAARLGGSSTKIDTSGPYFLSRQNHANFTKGHSDAIAERSPTWLTNDFGFGSQGQNPAGQIGDGKSIANWQSSLYGIDPADPTQPAVRNAIRPLGIVTNEPTPD